LWCLGRGRVVQVHEPVVVLLLPEQREVGAEPRGVEHHGPPSPLPLPLRPPRVRSARRARITRSSSPRTPACSIRPRISAANPYLSIPAPVSAPTPPLRG